MTSVWIVNISLLALLLSLRWACYYFGIREIDFWVQQALKNPTDRYFKLPGQVFFIHLSRFFLIVAVIPAIAFTCVILIYIVLDPAAFQFVILQSIIALTPYLIGTGIGAIFIDRWLTKKIRKSMAVPDEWRKLFQ